jgi:hypothetical protein
MQNTIILTIPDFILYYNSKGGIKEPFQPIKARKRESEEARKKKMKIITKKYKKRPWGQVLFLAECKMYQGSTSILHRNPLHFIM